MLQRKDNLDLIKPITIEELTTVVEDMEEDKVPGPDGFTERFIKDCWDIVSIDVYKMVTKTQNRDKIGGSTNSTFLSLIPKEKDVVSFDRFCPISLCNIGYKIITKIIAK